MKEIAMSCGIDKLSWRTTASLEHDTNIQRTAEFMARCDTDSVVVTEHERVIGVFTERDLIKRVIAAGRDPRQTSLGDVCTRNPVSVSDNISCETAIRTMRKHGCRRLLLYHQDKFLGVVTMQAVAQRLADHRSRKNRLVNFAGGMTLIAALALIALWLYQLPEMARLASQVMMQ
jgi:CBS domain-containing protein